MSFNDYLKTLKGMAVEGAQTAVKKTRETASIAKANIAIRGEEDKIRKAQIELGKLYYKDYIVGEEPDPAEYTPWCEKISESKIAIEDLKITIEDLRKSGAPEPDAEDAEEVAGEAVEPAGEAEEAEEPTACAAAEEPETPEETEE